MATLTAQDINVIGKVDLAMTTLTAADDFTFSEIKNEWLLLENTTGAPVTVSMLGADAPATIVCSGIGTVTVVAEEGEGPANANVMYKLNSIGTKLKGVTALTGGVGVEAALLSA